MFTCVNLVLGWRSLLTLHSHRWLQQKGMLEGHRPSSSPFPAPSRPTPSPAPGRGQRMEPIIFLNVPSLFLPISHLDWIQIPWLPVSLFTKVPNVNSKLTLFLLLLLYLTSIPSSLLTFSYCLKWVWMNSTSFKSPHLAALVTCHHWGRPFTWICEEALWTPGE